jgi:FkbM family methyltransferase
MRVILGPKGQQKKHWRKGGYYEQDMLQYIKKHYQGGTFIDGGSCLGNHTLFFAKHCNAHVVSIEPIFNSLALQVKMLEMNGLLDKVDVFSVALSDKDGFGSMIRFGDSVGHWKLEKGDYEVQIKTLDTIVQEKSLADIRLVKLDIEWSEINALKGATKLIQEQSPAFFIESNTQQERNQIMSILEPCGYRMVKNWHTNYEYRKVK